MKLEVPLSALVGLFGMATLKAPSKPDRLNRTKEEQYELLKAAQEKRARKQAKRALNEQKRKTQLDPKHL